MIEFHLTIYMCSHCTRVHNAAQDCLRHERAEHGEAETELTPVRLTKVEIPSESPYDTTVASSAVNAVPANVEHHADQHAEQSPPSTSTQPITDQTELPFKPVEQPLIVIKPDIEEEERPATPSTSSTRIVKMEVPETTVNAPNCRRVSSATSSPRVSVPGNQGGIKTTCPECGKEFPSVWFLFMNNIFLQVRAFRRHRKFHDPDDPTGYKSRKRAREATEYHSERQNCPKCSFWTTNVLDYKQHVLIHRQTAESPKIPGGNIFE